MEIIRFINSIFDSNTYLIKEEQSNKCCLVDCGDSETIIDEIQKQDLELTGIFITHSHFDHIYGLNEMTAYAPSVRVYISSHGREGLYSDRLNMSKYHSHSFTYEYNENIQVVEEGHLIQLFDHNDLQMKVCETPGHDWSSCCYKIENNVFSGDSYLPQHKVVASFPKSDKKKALESLELIKNIATDCNIYPGHGKIVYA